MIRRCCRDDLKNWDTYLPMLLLAYCEVPHRQTGFSPFELMYAYRVRGPLDVLQDDLTGDDKVREQETVPDYVVNAMERMERVTTVVHENLAQVLDKEKTWYDRGARAREFEPGQSVLVLLPTAVGKLEATWQGPFEVIEQTGPVTYRVRVHSRGRTRTTVYHVNLLRPWYSREDMSLFVG